MKFIINMMLVILLSFTLSSDFSSKSFKFERYDIEYNDIDKIDKKSFMILFYMENCMSCKLLFEVIEKRELFKNNNLYYFDINKILPTYEICFFNTCLQIKSVPLLVEIENYDIIDILVSYDEIVKNLS